jgi:hypothetical protein
MKTDGIKKGSEQRYTCSDEEHGCGWAGPLTACATIPGDARPHCPICQDVVVKEHPEPGE